jgi:TetR/AcrR family transcriptional regulator, cholesterol catabolism regulator
MTPTALLRAKDNTGMNTVLKGRKPRRAGPPQAEIEQLPNAREAILCVAAVLFSTKGFAESGLREIAENAGIRSSTVYYYFASKERIYEEIIRIAVDVTHAAVAEELAALPQQATPRMRVEAAIRGHLRALHSNIPFTSTNAQSRVKLPEAVNAVIRPLRDRYSDFWRKLLEEAQAAGWLKPGLQPRMLRPLILGTLNRTVGWFDSCQGPVQTLIDTTIVTFSGIWNDAPLPAATKTRNAKRAPPALPRR